ncbi:MAG: hypothetical protein ACKVOJ_10895 [Sphingomonadaceae bacterium]
MFIGHYSAAFIGAAQPKAPNLGTLFVAAQLVDFGFFAFTLVGVENMRITPGFTVMNGMDLYDMPYTHSLLGSLLWALGFAALIWMVSRRAHAAMIGGAVVLSHWVFDVLVHSQDMTFLGAPPKFGFGLWNYPKIEMPLEIILCYGAMAYFIRRTRRAASSLSVIILALFLIAVQAFNWFAPPPVAFEPSIPISGLIAFSVVAGIAYWAHTSSQLQHEQV